MDRPVTLLRIRRTARSGCPSSSPVVWGGRKAQGGQGLVNWIEATMPSSVALVAASFAGNRIVK